MKVPCTNPNIEDARQARLAATPRTSAHSLLLALVISVVCAPVTHADCLKNRDGEVMCGKGACEQDRKGEVLCTELGGGIVEDNNGDLYCGTGEWPAPGSAYTHLS